MLSASVSQSTRYFKRFRMEIDLTAGFPCPSLPEGFAWASWSNALLEVHAQVKHLSFADEIDAEVFPSLATLDGCYHLMREIVAKPGFRPEATWLISCAGNYCGTIQGIRERSGFGAIQNLGVAPKYRGRGLGKALLLMALTGFVQIGLKRAFLEVTAENESAIALYRQLGFRRRKTLYKAVSETIPKPTVPQTSVGVYSLKPQ